jgi:hypothetical protein
VTVGAGFEFQSSWLSTEFLHLFKRGDPTAENASWNLLASVLSAPPDRTRKFTLTLVWRDATKIAANAGLAFGCNEIFTTGYVRHEANAARSRLDSDKNIRSGRRRSHATNAADAG